MADNEKNSRRMYPATVWVLEMVKSCFALLIRNVTRALIRIHNVKGKMYHEPEETSEVDLIGIFLFSQKTI